MTERVNQAPLERWCTLQRLPKLLKENPGKLIWLPSTAFQSFLKAIAELLVRIVRHHGLQVEKTPAWAWFSEPIQIIQKHQQMIVWSFSQSFCLYMIYVVSMWTFQEYVITLWSLKSFGKIKIKIIDNNWVYSNHESYCLFLRPKPKKNTW